MLLKFCNFEKRKQHKRKMWYCCMKSSWRLDMKKNLLYKCTIVDFLVKCNTLLYTLLWLSQNWPLTHWKEITKWNMRKEINKVHLSIIDSSQKCITFILKTWCLLLSFEMLLLFEKMENIKFLPPILGVCPTLWCFQISE